MNANDTEIFEGILGVLNEAVRDDAEAVAALLERRVPCNDLLADHPDIAVQGGTPCLLGALGLVNGICTRLTGRVICATYDDVTGKLTGFGRYEKPGAEAAKPVEGCQCCHGASCDQHDAQQGG